MKITPPNPALASLASTLSKWVADERLAALCAEWSQYWAGTCPHKPEGNTGKGMPQKDSDFHVFSECLACVKMGWAGKSEFHAERLFRRMKSSPVLDKFPTRPDFNIPQVRDGKI